MSRLYFILASLTLFTGAGHHNAWAQIVEPQQADLPETNTPLLLSKHSLIQSVLGDKTVRYFHAQGLSVFLVQHYTVSSHEMLTQTHHTSKRLILKGSSRNQELIVTQTGQFNARGYLRSQMITRYRLQRVETTPVLSPLPMQPLKVMAPHPAFKTQPMLAVPPSYREIQKEFESRLIFGLPEEKSLVFMVDGSGSMNQEPKPGLSNLHYALEQLELTLQLLDPDQRFVVGIFSRESPQIFHSAKPVYATKENIKKAIQFLRSQKTLSSDVHEECGEIYQHLTREQTADGVYIFSDFEFDDNDIASLKRLWNTPNLRVYFKLMKTSFTQDHTVEQLRDSFPNGKLLTREFTFESSLDELKQLKALRNRLR